jgi:hypothetical protein
LVLYLYASTGKALGQRIGELGPQEMLDQRVGLTVADAAGIFDASFKRAELIECGCNMHYPVPRFIWSGAPRWAKPASIAPDNGHQSDAAFGRPSAPLLAMWRASHALDAEFRSAISLRMRQATRSSHGTWPIG